ncbi:MAG: hypothetical protein PHQ83_08980 [Eubacteriales bacterium]|nr:hypothetical protein [Eubacteriales bacterium]
MVPPFTSAGRVRSRHPSRLPAVSGPAAARARNQPGSRLAARLVAL